MAKVIKQYRYYTDNNTTNNQPTNVTSQSYVSGKVFENDNCFPILQLGIQTLPGTKFYLNNAERPIIVGATGIYELDIDGLAEIVKLTFDYTSMETIKNSDTGHLIVDIVYDDGSIEVEG